MRKTLFASLKNCELYKKILQVWLSSQNKKNQFWEIKFTSKKKQNLVRFVCGRSHQTHLLFANNLQSKYIAVDVYKGIIYQSYLYDSTKFTKIYQYGLNMGQSEKLRVEVKVKKIVLRQILKGQNLPRNTAFI